MPQQGGEKPVDPHDRWPDATRLGRLNAIDQWLARLKDDLGAQRGRLCASRDINQSPRKTKDASRADRTVPSC